MSTSEPAPEDFDLVESAFVLAEELRMSRVRLALAVAGAGTMHFVAPRAYQRMVPRWVPAEPAAVVTWTGALQLAAGALVLLPPTRRVGAWLALVMMVAAAPVSLHTARAAGPPRDLHSAMAWARIPLQIPLWQLAYNQARKDPAAAGSS